MRRLYPNPSDDVDLAEAYQAPGAAAADRPWLRLNMVQSLDGATTVDGRSGPLGGAGDRQVFSVIRSAADVVLVGAATVRAERYGPPKRTGLRIGVVSRSGTGLDWSWDLFTSGAGFMVLPEDGPDVPVETVRAGEGGVDLPAVLEVFRSWGTHVVLCEGGPTINGQLLMDDLVDEICLTLASLAAAGRSHRIAESDTAAVQHFDLAHVLEHEGELFLRYLRAR
jgi:riboflavin biosynthesis pyrimidine reductase